MPGARARRPALNRDDALAEAAEIPAEMDRLRAAIAALATRRRAAVEALLADGMTQAEIARRLRVTQRAVAKILGR
ncbi:MAG: sigma factor-like helix-turn-helix DNA-binding protein [Acidimicrobiales bacterium]